MESTKRKRGRPRKETTSTIDTEETVSPVKKQKTNTSQPTTTSYKPIIFPEDLKIQLKEILSKLSDELVHTIALENDITSMVKYKKLNSTTTTSSESNVSVNKEDLIIGLIERAVDVGTQKFFANLDRSDMIAAIKLLSNPNASRKTMSKIEIKTEFKNLFVKNGAEAFLNSLNEQVLELFVEALELDEQSKDHENLVDSLLEEIFLFGAKEVFTKCLFNTVISCAKQLNIVSIKNMDTCTKSVIVDHVLALEFPALIEGEEQQNNITTTAVDGTSEGEEDSEESTATASKKKRGRPSQEQSKNPNRPIIQKGITETDLTKYYFGNELVDFCKLHHLKYSPQKKSFLVAQILQYLNQEEEQTS